MKVSASVNFLAVLLATVVFAVQADKAYEQSEDPAEENYASDLYYQSGVQPYQQYNPFDYYNQKPTSFFGGLTDSIKRQDGFLADPTAAIAIAAVAVIGFGAVGAFAFANELNNLRDDINNNDSDIATQTTRVNSACAALNTIGSLAAVDATAAGAMADANAARINSIITAANSASCT